MNADPRHVGFCGLRLTVSGRNIFTRTGTWMARMAPRQLQQQLGDRFEIDHDADQCTITGGGTKKAPLRWKVASLRDSSSVTGSTKR